MASQVQGSQTTPGARQKLKRQVEQSTAASTPASKRVKRAAATAHYHNLVETGGRYFIPSDYFKSGGILVIPPEAVRTAINTYQGQSLEVRQSAVHNMGVHTKKALMENQVVAIYEGHQLRCRYMTDQEMVASGYRQAAKTIPKQRKRAGQSASTKSNKTAPQNKQLMWYSDHECPALISRPPSFHSYSENIRYWDKNKQPVWIGIDALDSPQPISHINSSSSAPNTILLPCLIPQLVQYVNTEGILLYTSPEPSEYCLIAVASQNIPKGHELLLQYGDDVQKTKKRETFWNPEDYFFSVISPMCVEVIFADNAATAVAKSSKDQSIRQEATDKLKQILMLSNESAKITVIRLTHKYINPLTGKQTWTPGCIQRLCQLWSILRAGKYSYLSYLPYCLDESGRLDNIGRSYLAGFIRNYVPSVRCPEPCPDSVDGVIDWLQSCVGYLAAQISQYQSQGLSKELIEIPNEQNRLLEGCQSLTAWRCRNEPDPQKKEGYVKQEQDKVIHFIKWKAQKAKPRNGSWNIVCFSLELSSLYLQPYELWYKFKQGPWRLAHVRIILAEHGDLPKTSSSERSDQPGYPDILSTYNPDEPDYGKAMKTAISHSLLSGTPQSMVKQGVCPASLRIQTMEQYEPAAECYPIPYLDEIPENLRGTQRWADLPETAWQVLGLTETPQQSLRKFIERFYERGGLKSVRKGLHNTYFSLVTGIDSIKPAIKSNRLSSLVLVRYLIKITGITDDKLASLWTPIDTLRVCTADTEEFNNAMELFLVEQCRASQSVYSIAAKLNDRGSGKCINKRCEAAGVSYQVERPAIIECSGREIWTGEDVLVLLQVYGLQPPHCDGTMQPSLQEQYKYELSQLDFGTFKAEHYEKYGFIDKCRRYIKRNPKFTYWLASNYQLDLSKLDKPTCATVRYVISILDVRFAHNKVLTKSMSLQEFDKISTIDSAHQDWESELLKLIGVLKNRKLNNIAVAKKLNTGEAPGHSSTRLYFNPIPVPPNCTEEKWTVAILENFLKQASPPAPAACASPRTSQLPGRSYSLTKRLSEKSCWKGVLKRVPKKGVLVKKGKRSA